MHKLIHTPGINKSKGFMPLLKEEDKIYGIKKPDHYLTSRFKKLRQDLPVIYP